MLFDIYKGLFTVGLLIPLKKQFEYEVQLADAFKLQLYSVTNTTRLSRIL